VVLLQRVQKFVIAFLVVLMLTTTTACSGLVQSDKTAYSPAIDRSIDYGQIARGDSQVGQSFGDWVVQTAKGLVSDSFVRDNDKLGVVISSQVRPNEVKPLAQSLVQGFRRNFPNKDLTVLMYAPDKKLILTAKYTDQSKQVEYQLPAA